jgi:hypothetical protein
LSAHEHAAVYREPELAWLRFKGASPRSVMDFVPSRTRAMLSRPGSCSCTPLFDGLNLVFLHRLVEVCRLDSVPAGTMLFRGAGCTTRSASWCRASPGSCSPITRPPRGSSCTSGTMMKYHPESAPPTALAMNQKQT